MKPHQAIVNAQRKAVCLTGGEHDTAGKVGFVHRAAAMGADPDHEDGADMQFRHHSHQQGRNAGGVGGGQFSEITHPHENGDIGIALAQIAIANQGFRKSKKNGIEDGIDKKGLPLRRHSVYGAGKRFQVSRAGRDKHRDRVRFVGQGESLFCQAKKVVGLGMTRTQQFLGLGGIHADLEALGL